MTQPPDPQPPDPQPPDPAPPAPPAPPDPQPPQPEDDPKELRAALKEERERRRAIEAKLAELTRQSLSDQERAVADARAEGKAEAEHAYGRKLAAAEFRAAAAGKLVNVDAALDLLDLAKFVTDSGEPNRKAIGDVVEQLAATPQQRPAQVPPGPRQPAPAEGGDFVRSITRRA
jgi:hypothetical protein